MIPEIHDKVWGSELWYANNEKYCGKILSLKGGFKSSLHRHLEKDETFFVRDGGPVLLELGLEQLKMEKGMSIRIGPKTWHRFSSWNDAVILEVSTHHSEDDVEREEVSGIL